MVRVCGTSIVESPVVKCGQLDGLLAKGAADDSPLVTWTPYSLSEEKTAHPQPSSLKMSKMAILFEAQKPGKNRAKHSNAELFIQANDTSLAQGKRILGEIKDILQKINVLQDVGGTKKQVADNSLKTNPVGSPREATKTHTKPRTARNSARFSPTGRQPLP
jgi:hypothetical protein